MNRVAGYVRVSTNNQVTDGESLETQKNQIREFCEFKKWKLIEIYEDAGISGSKADHTTRFHAHDSRRRTKKIRHSAFYKIK